MKIRELVLLISIGWMISISPTSLFAETTAAEAINPLIHYAAVEPQVSFKSVTELTVNQPDHRIAYGSDPLQHGLLWLPPSNSKKTLIVLIHGGCWLNAFGVDHSYPMATALSQSGHPVWSLEYRRTGDDGGGWPGSFEDIKSAMHKINLLTDYGVSTNEITLMGHSAGGHLALLAASELTDINFSQVIGLAAITDISRYALGKNSCQSAAPQFMNGLPHEQSTAYHQANLIYRQLPDAVTLLQGGADQIVPILQSQLHGVKAQIIPGAGHFDWIHPGSPAFQILTKVLEQ